MKKDIKALLNQVEAKLVKRVHERPSKDTLDHLALFVGFQSWESFQRQLHEGEDMDIEDVSPNVNNNTNTEKEKSTKK